MMFKRTLMALAMTGAVVSAQAVTLLNEGFENPGSLLAAGWIKFNGSAGAGGGGAPAWQGGDGNLFPAQGGSASSYMQANYTSSPNGAIDNWLITPTLSFSDQLVTLSFYVRTEGDTFGWIDRLRVSYNNTAAITNPWANFSHTLVDINAAQAADGMPQGWTKFTAKFGGMAKGTQGHIAFEYLGDNATANMVALDSVNVTAAVPEPESYALMGLGLGVLAFVRRRRA